MSANDSKKYRRNVSFEPVHSVSVRGHRHQASDSGVGSDQDSYSTSPDRSAQAYFELHKAHLSLKSDYAKLQDELRDVKARFTALENSVEVLTDDKDKLVREKRTLKEENDKLKDGIRKTRTSRPREREPEMTGALPVQQPPSPKEKTRRGESKVRRSESKRRTSDDEKRHEEKRHEEKERKERKERDREREKLHEEDKKRLKSRFDHKDNKDDGSVSSGSSGRKSYVEPYGPSAPRSTTTAERPRKSRTESSYNQIRPQVIATTTISDYEGSAVVYNDDYAGEDGHYHAFPLASPLPSDTSRGRPHSRW